MLHSLLFILYWDWVISSFLLVCLKILLYFVVEVDCDNHLTPSQQSLISFIFIFFVSLCVSEKIQWVQCEDCSKWRKVPANARLPSKWTCSGNLWDPERYNQHLVTCLNPDIFIYLPRLRIFYFLMRNSKMY